MEPGAMDIGLLWYDGDPKRTLEEKVETAARRYHEKFGRWPNRCHVHPQVLDDGHTDLSLLIRVGESHLDIRVLSAPNILLHHYWIGEHEDLHQQEREPSCENQDAIGENNRGNSQQGHPDCEAA